MATSSRTSQLGKVHKVLKKHYEPVAPDPERTVFEHLMFACCLENAPYDPAEEAFAALEHNFFDWNEIRVTTIRELSEVMARLSDPPAAANRVKRVLQSIFESTYSYDLEDLRKQNLGPAVTHLKKLDGTTNFSVAYVTQAALGGHAIPVDAGVLDAFCVVELVTEHDVVAGVVPGLERAVAKSKGLEFGSQLHQFGAEFAANPYAPALHAILLEINPDARGRLPKRRGRKASRSSAQSGKRQSAQKKAGKRARAAEATGESKKKQAGQKKKSAKSQPTESDKKRADQQGAAGSKEASPAGQQASAGKKKPAAAKRKPAARKKSDVGTRKTSSAGLSKRKPR